MTDATLPPVSLSELPSLDAKLCNPSWMRDCESVPSQLSVNGRGWYRSQAELLWYVVRHKGTRDSIVKWPLGFW